MSGIRLEILSEKQIRDIHEASLAILRDTGVLVHDPSVLRLMGEAGARVESARPVAHLSESLVMGCVARAGKRYILHGRDPERTARFGYGDMVLMSSSGQYQWIDGRTGASRPATLQDARDAIRLGDALCNITVVGSMAQPAGIGEAYREVALTAELVKGSTKPTRTWVHNGRTARQVLEIYRAAAGGDAALRARPMTEAFLEPISPLQLPLDGLEMVREFVRAGQPVSIGPMAMASGTAPATLAGTLAQENAEILAGLVAVQLLGPGTAVMYGGIPHVMDPRTSICSFGSPEQGLMAVAMTQMGKSYGLPVYVNVGLTDAKLLDAQAGAEKMGSLLLGALAGADQFGHAGICGTDHGGSLEWLYADHEMMDYVRRVARGFGVGPAELATNVVQSVGPGGNFLAEEHTVEHFRREIWLPGAAWTRETFAGWTDGGRQPMADRIAAEVRRTLESHVVAPPADALTREIDGIVEAARRDTEQGGRCV